MSGSCSHDTQNFKVLHESRKTEEHPPIDTKDLLISGGLSSERVMLQDDSSVSNGVLHLADNHKSYPEAYTIQP